MPIEVKILDSELTGFSAPAQDRLREAMQEYATSVVQEANRIESSRNIGHGPNEITSAMVSSAVVVQQQGLGPRTPKYTNEIDKNYQRITLRLLRLHV